MKLCCSSLLLACVLAGCSSRPKKDTLETQGRMEHEAQHLTQGEVKGRRSGFEGKSYQGKTVSLKEFKTKSAAVTKAWKGTSEFNTQARQNQNFADKRSTEDGKKEARLGENKVRTFANRMQDQAASESGDYRDGTKKAATWMAQADKKKPFGTKAWRVAEKSQENPLTPEALSAGSAPYGGAPVTTGEDGKMSVKPLEFENTRGTLTSKDMSVDDVRRMLNKGTQ